MTCIDITKNSLSAAFRQQQITNSMEHLPTWPRVTDLPLNSARKSYLAPRHSLVRQETDPQEHDYLAPWAGRSALSSNRSQRWGLQHGMKTAKAHSSGNPHYDQHRGDSSPREVNFTSLPPSLQRNQKHMVESDNFIGTYITKQGECEVIYEQSSNTTAEEDNERLLSIVWLNCCCLWLFTRQCFYLNHAERIQISLCSI